MIEPFDPLDPATYLSSAEFKRFKALMDAKQYESPKKPAQRSPGRKNKLFAGIPLRHWAALTNKAPQWIHYLHNKGQLQSWLAKHGFIEKDLSA